MTSTQDILKKKLNAFKKKYYTNILIKNVIIFIALVLSIYLIITGLESSFSLNTLGRTILFFSSIVLLLIILFKLIIKPYLNIIRASSQITDEEAAKLIGQFFPEIKDKLLNTIQLSRISDENNSLILASIEKRSLEISPFEFTTSIDFKTNKKYLKYAAYPSLILVLLFFLVPQYLTESTNRIVNYDKEFEPSRLFQIIPVNKEFIAFKNEDFVLEVEVIGSAIPDQIYVDARGRKAKMKNITNGHFEYTFTKVQDHFHFKIEAADYESAKIEVEVLQRPDIKAFNIDLNYPDYTGKKDEKLENVGNLIIPEGTLVTWTVQTVETQKIQIQFVSERAKVQLESIGNQLFEVKKTIKKSDSYQLHLENENSRNKDSIAYQIDVIKDEFPKIAIDTYQDTTLYAFIIFNGLVSDDYGISKLEFVYTKNDTRTIHSIPFNKQLTSQDYYYQWNLDSLDLKEGENIEYFIRVWDNDGINGKKPSQTATYNFKLPEKNEIKEKIDKQAIGAKKELDKSLEEAQDLNDQIKDIQNDLKSKENLNWQENKKVNDLIKQKEKLENAIEKISQQNKDLAKKQERFNQPNEKLQQKVAQLQKLMDEILDEETKQLYKELKKLLEEQKGSDDIEEVMDQIEKKEENLQKEIERAIEMFKRLQFDYKMDEIINDLDKLEKEQEKLSEETLDKKNDTQSLKEQQEELNKDFEDIEKQMEQLDELNQEMKQPENLEDLSEEESNIKKEQQESQKQLQDNKRKKSSESQKKAADNINQMKNKMSDMQASMEMMMMQENLDHLRDIIDNLVKISFDQERIMTAFKGVNQSDPRFVTLSQEQLKLKDDAVIIEDSLLSLANRVFQIQSFITREVGAMNDEIEASLQGLKDRRMSEATTHQQYAMSAINNLALLLDDVLQQMQQQMADAMGKPQKGQKGKKKNMSGLSELQQQLNKKIEDLKKSGKSGRPLSKELAELAAEQEMLRNELQNLQDQLEEKEGEGTGKNLKEAIEKMEKTEQDLVNKRITQETINRQKDILTRMLKAENALRERELDHEREAEQANNYERALPPAFEEYIKAKQKELELLNTVPPKMNPYYKEEVNKYFRRLNEQ
ncbi:hypothetical protein N7E81_04870 [Reichenbachiella carrageenanivorans]|uniref:Uncharacterized protein n=1 Tax=Reichenbachiella carrageenanivorans TaxID=2979869 RepID=A0ABY6D2P1_9BACT|nr:DUF4175 family protein [Reichenbachiella carrageenanivorans]UXX80431.1 hypothetical protein N7E81_04870 [Reichenbachiella carrageenanivorans]